MGIDDDDEEVVRKTVDEEVVAQYFDDYNDQKEVAENFGTIPGCSERCMASYVAAFVELLSGPCICSCLMEEFCLRGSVVCDPFLCV